MTRMEWKLELIVVPLSDVDRAKAFYADQTGFVVDVDHRVGEHFRVVQLTPRGSACSIALVKPDIGHSRRRTRGGPARKRRAHQWQLALRLRLLC